MKKFKISSLLLICLTVLTLCSCSNTHNAEIDYGKSEIYSQEDMESAINLIKKDFSEMKGCKLYSLTYMGDEESKENLEYCRSSEKGNFDQCIVFKSHFRSPLIGGGAWEKNEEYYWKWFLARKKGGEWVVLTKGV